MTNLLRILSCAAALFAAGGLSAQTPECRHGPDDEKGLSVSVAMLAHPTRVAATLDSLLRVQGYAVSASPAATGSWSIEPRFTWLTEVKDEDWHGEDHPGVLVSVQTEARGDSTAVTLGARTLCKVPAVPGGPEEIGTMVELISAMTLAAGVAESLDSARAAGIDPLTPVARQQRTVQAPEKVGEFRVVGRHDYPDRRLGTTVRYAADDERYVDIYVYPGVRVDSTCDAACAVDAEADGFVESIPELVRAGRFEQLEVAGDERFQPAAGAEWAYGRHLSLKGRSEGVVVDSHYFLYSFPGFFLKVRATFPPSPDALADVKAFLVELLGTLMAPSE
ncbi:MAG TPA: hypothetical protein VFT45_22775 [Longimicrobium sp.]|nr:hypothetical protein [Longimicrobium sp.]